MSTKKSKNWFWLLAIAPLALPPSLGIGYLAFDKLTKREFTFLGKADINKDGTEDAIGIERKPGKAESNYSWINGKSINITKLNPGNTLETRTYLTNALKPVQITINQTRKKLTSPYEVKEWEQLRNLTGSDYFIDLDNNGHLEHIYIESIPLREILFSTTATPSPFITQNSRGKVIKFGLNPINTNAGYTEYAINWDIDEVN